MKWLILIALLLSAPAQALDSWTWTDSALEATFLTLTLIDWGQTNSITAPAKNTILYGGGSFTPDKPYHEVNPILGHSPSRAQIGTYFIAVDLAHVALAVVLPKPYREIFQAGTIAIEGWVVGRNAHFGFTVRF